MNKQEQEIFDLSEQIKLVNIFDENNVRIAYDGYGESIDITFDNEIEDGIFYIEAKNTYTSLSEASTFTYFVDKYGERILETLKVL